jgi:hypothetical protein
MRDQAPDLNDQHRRTGPPLWRWLSTLSPAPSSASGQPGRGAPRGISGREYGALAALLLFAGAFILIVGHGLTFRHDEWDFIESRDTGGADAFLQPFNGHFSLVPVAIYRLLFLVVGLGHYFWFRLVLVVYDLLCGFFLWMLLRRRVSAVLALAGTALLLLCGPLYENYIFPIEIGQVGSVLGGLMAWNLLDDTEHPRRGLLLLALAFSLSSSAIGVAVLVAVGVEVVLRRDRPYVAIVAAALALFMIWYVGWGRHSGGVGFGDVPGFMSGLIAFTVTGTFGLWPLLHLSHPELRLVALALAAATVALAHVAVRRGWFGRRPKRISPEAAWPRIAGLVFMALTFWVITSAARSGAYPYRSRYIEPGAIVIVLLLAEFLAYRIIPNRTQIVLAGLAATLILCNLPYLARYGGKYRTMSRQLIAQITALKLARPYAPADFEPSPSQTPQVQANLFFAAERRIGRFPTLVPRQLLTASESLRAAADQTLIRMSLAQPHTALARCGSGTGRPALTLRDGAAVRGGTVLQVINPGATPATLFLRVFASTPIAVPERIAPGSRFQLPLVRNQLSAPWHVSASAHSSISACS